MKIAFKTILALMLAALAMPAWAHGLLISAEANGRAIEGRVYYSDGTPGAGEYVELKSDAGAENAAQTAVTDAEGGFRFTGTSGQSYRIVAHGEEGHTTELSIALEAGERGKLVERAPTGSQAEGDWLPPAWMLIGGVLLLSLIPVFLLGRRGTATDPG